MANNSTLGNAKAAKNDEFYTQLPDIEQEMQAYVDWNPQVFRDKTILLPCDDPEWSNFTRYFALNFQLFGIRRLISTSYAPDAKAAKYGLQPPLFPEDAFSGTYGVGGANRKSQPPSLKDLWQTHGRIFVLDRDVNGDNRIDIDDLRWEYLEGDGDFRSKEVTRLRDEADIIITNPPFSLFREFLKWIMDGGKQFSIIGNMNAITYKEVFPLLKDNKVWLGNGFSAGNAYFATPNARKYGDGVLLGDGLVKFRNCCWFTNIEHGRRHEPLPLMTMADNLRFSRHKEIRGRKEYQHYDNYDAIEVPYTDAIPSDYTGVMGVPISFLDKYCPEQFRIIWRGGDIEWATNKNKLFTPPQSRRRIEVQAGRQDLAGAKPVCSERQRQGTDGVSANIHPERLEELMVPGCDKYDRPYIDGHRMYYRIFIQKLQ